jgi:hypothetical protein
MKKDDIDSKSVVTAKESSDKKTKKTNAVAKEVNKIAIHVDSTENSSQESELMKQINATDLKQKLAQTINQSMTIRNDAKHLEVHVSGPFQNNKSGKSYWIVVLGDNGQTWLIKPEFVTG